MEAVMDGDPFAVWRVRAPGIAIALSTTEVVTLLARSTEFRLAVMRWLHQSILEARRLNITNVQGQATARVSWLLSHLCRAHSHREFAIEQAEIARLLGLQRTTVCGAMVSLKRHGLIAHMRGRVRVLNHDRLEELANAVGFTRISKTYAPAHQTDSRTTRYSSDLNRVTSRCQLRVGS
jgi:CRP-like cAMP-binding protein